MKDLFNPWGQFRDRTLESQFRAYAWAQEHRLVPISFAILSLTAFLSFLASTLLTPGRVTTISLLRLAIALSSLLIASLITRAYRRALADCIIIAWWACIIGLQLVVILDISELPASTPLFYAGALVPVFITYFFLPLIMPARVICASLITFVHFIGVLRFFPETDSIIATILLSSGAHMLGAFNTWKIERLRRKLYFFSVIDPLTQAFNRRYFHVASDREIQRSRSRRWDLTLLAFDLDRFKNVNDFYGHQAGDETLKQFVRVCLRHSRSEDFLVRMGGEEFVMLLPHTNSKGAEIVAEKIRAALECEVVNVQDRQLHITVSIGISQWQPAEDSIEETLDRADQAMYLAKSKGRNRVEVSTSSAPSIV